MSRTPPPTLTPSLLNPISPLDTCPIVSAWQLDACAAATGLNNEVEPNVCEQPGAQTWTRTENNGVSRRSERSRHRDREPGPGFEFVNDFKSSVDKLSGLVFIFCGGGVAGQYISKTWFWSLAEHCDRHLSLFLTFYRLKDWLNNQ